MSSIQISDQDSVLTIFKTLLAGVKDGLSSLSKWDRAARIFWLLGPFILLIERSPADLWVTVLALGFVLRSIVIKDGSWLGHFWVKAVFAFWAVALLSAAISKDPAYALGEAFVWIRFPLFAFASVFWLGKDKRLLYAMFVSTGLGMVMMCFILLAELLIIGQVGGRLSWPYGDLTPGNYLAKAGLPAFSVMIALAVSIRGPKAAWIGVLSLFTLIMSIMTGERINFLIRACGGMLAGLVWRPKWKRYLGLVVVEVLAVVALLNAAPGTSERYITHFVDQIPTGMHSPYYRTMKPGMIAFEQAPILGIGTGNFRNQCPDLIKDEPKLECHPHPHNFYIQLLAENGIVGLIFGCVMLGSILFVCFQGWLKNRDNVLSATAFVMPLGFFWPIASSSDFFGQWNNIFMWSAVALALAAAHLRPAKEQ